ncbi:MAG: uptake lipoprotein-like protein [Candidatus Angelobacter sp.]|jgi:outer membrane protein assembly factor BamD|nr:uptake lipoprotein-like protein [Candidatus Angelobacter sp.]
MFRRTLILFLLIVVALAGAGCRKNKAVNPIAQVDSKQPDKVLFDRSMDALQHNKFDTARITLQTLINTYPDSEYIARAKLAVGDSWYEEGSSAALQQAEAEYKDFITFFPNMPEAAEAQLKVAGIHYKQMEKPDRDFTHAKRAEDEYRQLIQQFPDSKLVPEAKQRLLQVQEVLAEREYRIGRFYFVRESYAASIARLRSLVDAYPLYSQIDEALFTLGQAYEGEINTIRAGKLQETPKANVLNDLTNRAAESYAKIVSRYPAMDRVADAKNRLQALHRPIPTPTPEMIAQNKKEEESRSQSGRLAVIMGNFKKRPDMAQAVKIGEPSLEEPKQTSAPQVMKDLMTAATKDIDGKASVETIKPGASKESDPVPRSQLAAPPPNQVNDVAVESSPKTDSGAAESSSKDQGKTQTKDNKDQAQNKDAKDQDQSKDNKESSSKQKKKKGLRKLIPF